MVPILNCFFANQTFAVELLQVLEVETFWGQPMVLARRWKPDFDGNILVEELRVSRGDVKR